MTGGWRGPRGAGRHGHRGQHQQQPPPAAVSRTSGSRARAAGPRRAPMPAPRHTPLDASDCAAESCCLDARRTKDFRQAATSFCGRRAMVNKLWCRELTRRWFQAKFEPPKARCFSEPKCQDGLRAWYLFYRWLIFALWLSIVICSIFELGSYKPLGSWEKWPIYLTNWDLSLGLCQSLLGAVVVTRRWRRQRGKPDFDPDQLVYGKLERVYWFFYVVTSSVAIGVTVTYWSLVHDPSVMHVDAANILSHVVNSLLMLIDFAVAGVPFELRCFWWAPSVVGLYLLFTVVYYLAGGVDKWGHHHIYNMLDWEKPGRTLLVSVGGLIFLIVTHCLLYFLARFRERAYGRRREYSSEAPGSPRKVESSCV